MSQPEPSDTTDRLAAWTLAAASFVVPLAYSSSLADPFSFPKRTAILAAAIVLGAIATLRRPARESARVTAPVMPPAIVFLACAAFACVRAVNVGLALWSLLDLAAGILLLAGTIGCLRDAAAVRLVFRSFLAAASLGALGSLLQIFLPGQQTSWLAYLLPPNRGGSTLGDPALTAQCLILALPVGVGAAALSSGTWRLVCGGLLGIVAATLVFIGRPEGWIGGVSALAFILVGRVVQAAGRGGRWSDLAPDLAGEGLRAFLIGGIVFLVIIALSRFAVLYPGGKPVTPLAGVSLLSPTTGDASADRAAAIPGTFSLIRRHPLGVGPGCWRHAFLEVAWQGPGATPFTLSHQAVHPGNAFLEFTAETGVAGGVAFALLVLLVLAQSLAAARGAGPPWDGTACAAFGAVGALVVMSFFGAPLQEPAPSFVFWIAAGAAHAAAARVRDAPRYLRPFLPRERPGGPRLVLAGRATGAVGVAWLACVTCLGFLVWDRARASMLSLAGQGAFYSGQYEAALLAFGRPPARRSPDHLSRVLMASAYLRLKFYKLAAQEFDETLRRSPHFIAAYLGRATAWEAQGLWDQADADYQAALRIWPRNPDILLALARLNTERGRLDDALDDYRQVMNINPDLADTYFQMGEIFLRRNQLDEAIEAYRVCGMKNPKYPRMRLRLGDVFFQKGLQEMALRYYQAAAGEDDKDVDARLRLANVYHAMGQPCDAREALEAARDLETDTIRRQTILDLIKKVETDCHKPPGKSSVRTK